MVKHARTAIVLAARRFARAEDGATAIEYAMIASGIAVAIAATLVNLGSNVNAMYTTVSNAMK